MHPCHHELLLTGKISKTCFSRRKPTVGVAIVIHTSFTRLSRSELLGHSQSRMYECASAIRSKSADVTTLSRRLGLKDPQYDTAALRTATGKYGSTMVGGRVAFTDAQLFGGNMKACHRKGVPLYTSGRMGFTDPQLLMGNAHLPCVFPKCIFSADCQVQSNHIPGSSFLLEGITFPHLGRHTHT